MKKLIIFSTVIFLLSGCNDGKDLNPIPIHVTDIRLDSIGQISSEEFFQSEYKDDALICTVRTKRIKKNDRIRAVLAERQNNNLSITIIAYPHEHGDFCTLESCMMYHDVSFHLIRFYPREYNVSVDDNGLLRRSFKYNLKEEFYISFDYIDR